MTAPTRPRPAVREASLDASARRRSPQLTAADHLDLVVAERSIPRGRDADDPDRTPAVDADLWHAHVRYARTSDARQLDALVAEYDRYATSLARRLHRDREPREDLDQLAREALVVALQRFDPERGLPFVSYATPTILGALRRHYRDHGWLIRVPRRAHELATSARTTSERLLAELGRQPTMTEVADALGVPVDDLLLAQDALHARETSSLDALGRDGAPPSDHVGADDPAFDRVEDRTTLAAAMATLNDASRELVRLYYFEGRNQSQIAEEMGVSQMQVSRLLSAVINRLRQQVAAPAATVGG